MCMCKLFCFHETIFSCLSSTKYKIMIETCFVSHVSNSQFQSWQANDDVYVKGLYQIVGTLNSDNTDDENRKRRLISKLGKENNSLKKMPFGGFTTNIHFCLATFLCKTVWGQTWWVMSFLFKILFWFRLKPLKFPITSPIRV